MFTPDLKKRQKATEFDSVAFLLSLIGLLNGRFFAF